MQIKFKKRVREYGLMNKEAKNKIIKYNSIHKNMNIYKLGSICSMEHT